MNARLQDRRIMDNSKILNTVGIRQEELMSLFDGLTKELSNKDLLKSILMDYRSCIINWKMDKITHTHIPINKYFVSLLRRTVNVLVR